MLPLCAAPLASENPCDLSAKVFRDPHINFAYGGSADLRGRHNALYNFLSAPGLSVNVKTEEALFKIHDGALTVNGSFLTEAHVVARVYSRYTAEASFFASQLSDNNWGWSVVNGTCAGRPFRFGKHGGKKCFALEMAIGPLIRHLLPAAVDHHCARHALGPARRGSSRRPEAPSRRWILRAWRRSISRQAARHHRPVLCHAGARAARQEGRLPVGRPVHHGRPGRGRHRGHGVGLHDAQRLRYRVRLFALQRSEGRPHVCGGRERQQRG